MSIDSSFDLERTQIQFANETKAFALDGSKVVAQPITFFRHIYAETINTQDANARLILETNAKQSYICSFIFTGTNLSYRIEVTQRNNNISTVQSQIGTSQRRLFSIESTSIIYNNVFVPPLSVLYIVAYNQISQVFVTAQRYYTDSMIRVG